MSNVSRTQNAKRNLTAGFINKISILLIQFCVRTFLIRYLGAKYLGLNNLFASILQVLNMAELGFSSAIVFSLYKPIAENDYGLICALLKFYRNVYKVIGVTIMCVGGILTPLIPKLINGEVPNNANVFVLYWIFLLNTVLSYLAYAYRSVILTANQRQDIISKISFILDLAKGICQCVSIVLLKNYYAYVIWNIVFTIFNNLVTAYITKRDFPEYVCKGELPKTQKESIIIQIKGLAIGQISKIARNSLDSVILSATCGLVITAVYSNYYYILSAIIGVLGVITQSIAAGIGNSIATETKDKNYNDLLKFNFYLSWIGSWCTLCLFFLYQPFMELWAGTGLMATNHTMLLFCVYFYILQMGQIRSTYANAAGIWWEFRWLEILEIFANLILNIGLGCFWGVDGILWATIITVFFFSIIATTIVTFKCCFDRSAHQYFIRCIFYVFATVASGVITEWFCSLVSFTGISQLVYRAFVLVIVPNVVLYLIFCINRKHNEYMQDLKNKLLKKK